MAPFKFVDRVARGLPIDKFGDGRSARDYTYVGDIVAGVVAALDRPMPSHQVVNLGNSQVRAGAGAAD
jgi:UDP-glucuronate 4-epimerase